MVLESEGINKYTFGFYNDVCICFFNVFYGRKNNSFFNFKSRSRFLGSKLDTSKLVLFGGVDKILCNFQTNWENKIVYDQFFLKKICFFVVIQNK